MFVDRLLLWLHIGFAIFTIGPITAATMSTPRYIRAGEISVVRFLNRITRFYGLGSLLVFAVGLGLARGRFDQFWLSAAMTLFIVGLVLLLAIVEPDQRKAVKLLASKEEAHVQTGRIVAVSSAVSAIWLVILVLMIWQP